MSKVKNIKYNDIEKFYKRISKLEKKGYKIVDKYKKNVSMSSFVEIYDYYATLIKKR